MRYTHPFESEICFWSGTRAQFAFSFASKAIRPADIQAITQIYMISPAHSTGCIMGCQLHPKSPSVNRWQIVCSWCALYENRRLENLLRIELHLAEMLSQIGSRNATTLRKSCKPGVFKAFSRVQGHSLWHNNSCVRPRYKSMENSCNAVGRRLFAFMLHGCIFGTINKATGRTLKP